MAATARVLAGTDKEFVERVDEHLYRGKGPDYFDPGPLTREIAAWKQAYPEIQLATFNYDQLLERALQDVGLDRTAARGQRARAGRHRVCPPPPRTADGHACQRRGGPHRSATMRSRSPGSWQDDFMSEALTGVCVFLGLSFTDQNLLRWIYGATGSRHVAVLTRQSLRPGLSGQVRREARSPRTARDWQTRT